MRNVTGQWADDTHGEETAFTPTFQIIYGKSPWWSSARLRAAAFIFAGQSGQFETKSRAQRFRVIDVVNERWGENFKKLRIHTSI